MDLNLSKSIILVILFLTTFALSMLPLKLVSIMEHTMDPRRRYFHQMVLSLLNCFGGGVFLAACLLDLFPEVRDQLTVAFNELKIATSFPVAEFVMVFGFFLVFIIEQMVLSWRETRVASNEERRPLLDGPSMEDGINGTSRLPINTNKHDHHHHSSRYSSTSLDRHSMYDDSETPSTLRSILLMMALSLHSVFEGLAIGLQPGSNELYQILTAVVIHKSVIAFSLGLNLVQSKLSLRTTVVLNAIFSVTTPVGIASGIGIIRLSHSASTPLFTGILQGIACGTFLFVTFFEVLPHEMDGVGSRLLKVLATIFGFGAVCGALFLDPSV